MGKEGTHPFLFNSQGKINIVFVLSLLFVFVMMLWVVNATIVADTPKGSLSANAQTNFSSLPIELQVNVTQLNDSELTNKTVWVVLNSQPNGLGTNESTNRTMTGTATTFKVNLTSNFSNAYTGPGPHSAFFCTNASNTSSGGVGVGHANCTGPYDYVIKGVNVSEMERQFGEEIQSPTGGFAFSGMDIRYGNGTDVPFGTFMDPTTGNFTFNINFSSNMGVYIVGGRIDESQFANASRTNYSAETTLQTSQAAGTGYVSNITWVDIKSFIPSEVSYEFGIIQMPETYSKVMYCNGTSISSPNCSPISQCNASNIGLFNYTEVIPPSSPGPHACWLTSGGWGEEPVNLASGFTYIFTRAFSGGLGGNDRGVPDINFNSPTPLLNVSTVAARLINFTVQDINSTGINLTRNGTINLSIILGGSTLIQFVYVNNSALTNLTCTTDDSVSSGNTTSVNCNVTYTFASNGIYSINATAVDDSNNSNYQFNATQLTVDQIPPVNNYFNISDSTSLNASGDDSALQLGASTPAGIPLSGSGSWAQGRTFFATANWTDNLTQPLIGLLQFYNETAGSWQTLNESEANYLAYSNNSWTNFTFPVPGGHNVFEGNNVTFRILANDTLGNVNSSAVINLTISINDTTVPTITINGTISANGTNTTNTRPLISWAIVDNSALTSINVSVDGTVDPGKGVESNCQKYAFFDTTAGSNNVEKYRNSSFQIVNDPACTLGNGSHFVRIIAIDTLSNSLTLFYNFSVQSGSIPSLQFNLTVADAAGTHGKAAVNDSNITSSVGITLFGTNGVGSSIDQISYISSCDSTTRVEGNNTVVYPFNASSCSTQSENRTLTVTINDTAGNSNTTVLGFLVDNVAPTLTVNNPTEGRTYTDIESIFNLTVLDDDQAISSLGYYLDEASVPTVFNISGAIGGAGVTTTQINTTNLTIGTHTIKFTVNDTLGNIRNGSVITFTQDGPIEFLNINASLEGNLTAYYNSNISNISIRQKTDAGTYSDITVTNGSSNTYEILYQINGTTNVTLTEINGSAANWGKLNIVPVINDIRTIAGIQNNWTNTVLSSVVFNNSLEEFITNNNSYHGVVTLPFIINLTNASRSTIQELWWVENEGTLTTRTNISQCTSAFTRTTTTPCWNYTIGERTLIQVPHFSAVLAINDSTAATITVNTPSSSMGNHTVSMFEPNITVSSDAISCIYQVNGSSPVSMTKTGTSCIGQTERFKNLDGGYNITFNATDSSGNVGSRVFRLNISDNTAPDNGLITVSSTGEKTATIKITGANESVNATVMIANGSSTIGNEEDFNVTQSVSITGLVASTTYFYNVTVCDFNGNCKTNSTVSSFTTSAAAAAAATTTTTTSGGGGGAAAVVSKVADSKAQVWSRIPAGSSISLNVDRAKIAVTSVAVNNVKSELKSVDLEVAALKENPVSTVPAPTVYQYLRINKKNLKNTDAEGFKVGFRVTKSWLTANNLASGDIVLYRYRSGWNQLTTMVTGTDNVYVNYEADTPGLSSFAIGVRTAVEAPPEVAPGVPGAPTVPTVPTAPTAPERVVPVPPPEAVEMPEPVETPSRAPAAWLIAAVVVIIGIVLIVMYQRRKNQV